jgi:hypothetical protein
LNNLIFSTKIRFILKCKVISFPFDSTLFVIFTFFVVVVVLVVGVIAAAAAVGAFDFLGNKYSKAFPS